MTLPDVPPDEMAALLEAMPMAVAVFERSRELRFANKTARTLLGFDERKVGAHAPIDVALAAVMASVAPLLRAVTVDHANHVTMARVRHLSGSEQIVEVRICLVGDGLLLFTGTEVTSRETLLVALERRARELGAIFEVTPTIVRVLDASGAIIRSNANAMREYAGVSISTLRELWEHDKPGDPVDQSPLAFSRHPGVLAIAGEIVRARLLTVVRGGNPARSIIEVYAAPILDADSTIIGAVLVDRDVTAEHRLAVDLDALVKQSAMLNERVSTESERLERMVEERSRELLELQETRSRERRLAAVGQLAAGVMHDVNNALNPIMAAAYLLRVHAENPDAVRDYADRIGKAAETGAATASRVGRFIRQEPSSSLANTVVDLSELTEEVLSFTQPLHQERRGDGTRVTVVRDYQLRVNTRGIAGEIREALLNLVQNAMHAMPAGGTLTARTGIVGGEAWVAIADSGEGMTDDVRERAFEPFFSTKGAGGSGLGLAEVYGIVRRHRGRADIVSAPQKGTTVTLFFPLESVASVAPAADRGIISAQRILVVEDHVDGREFLCQLLRADGHLVQHVATYDDARLLLNAPHQPPYDVVVTDIGLPDGSGWELVSLVRARWPAIRVGVVTGWEPTSGETADRAHFLLRKPFRAIELLAQVAGQAVTAQRE
ncbi:MAG: ATP-binding protein [Gemmatimonadota bacterium]|nr:ATP-binding protein [Gemmatimonadota bacterium]